jgi:hypothetical protein
MKRQRLEALTREMKLEEDKLTAQMEFAKYEHETESLKNQGRGGCTKISKSQNLKISKSQNLKISKSQNLKISKFLVLT